MKTTHIGLLGLGTVGKGVVEALSHQNTVVIDKVLVRDVTHHHSNLPLTTDIHEILDNPDIDIVVEVMGGIDPAYEYLATALQKGKSVVTANKEVVARFGPKLMAMAREHRQGFLFEASVGGGMPILDALTWHLNATPIHAVEGVVNGTTNFILDQMEQGMDYQAALQRAQALGFAEQDPSADVDGWDSARKLSILAGLAFHSWIDAENGYVKGITEVRAAHLHRLKEMGFGVRLVARAERHPSSIGFVVAPTVYPLGHRYLKLAGSQNAIGIFSDAGTTWIEGPGAGGLATATSIVSDIQRIRFSVPDRDPIQFESLPVENINDAYLIFAEDPERPLPVIAEALKSGPGYLILPYELPHEEGFVQYRYRAK
ncbi:homoserine dehydrogenase [Sulfobacillus thermosulfidooxidans DSM 9293]|uniref:Homoserine dehydrogenase n=1 Tax=Sulfobacillus thermosulfidooxidans (strain DSM 9293 / VKM B-1269 / AT-1) TaxID=929705 RepID=A0A1W1W981_SULTA|nr:homoserine dehydrogenase [Sulfobacillus thermosulfidooxidans]SMC02303.1 homoserine dehydrogenase [Sulfobacillus thermosulfidooxidans DSM 9293]